MASFLSLSKIKISGSDSRSETQSEVSSADSELNDLRSIAIQLGVSVDELSVERFKIERQKLESMLSEGADGLGTNKAEMFFQLIMQDTCTYICWPCRLKIGAKTKKDPHVKIIGKSENVLKAKERVMGTLNSRGMRVTMKLDVSYTDHSFIIGKSGKIIKKIMEDTQTHIHFPDSNRNNQNEKSNQVSLNGALEGVEKARAFVRESAPLVLQFDLPILAPTHPVPDNESPYIKEVQQSYEVQIAFSNKPKLHSLSVIVKGSERNCMNVKIATQLLIDKFCTNTPARIDVMHQMEISPQHHCIVKGKDNRNLLRIMEYTSTRIIFPDLTDANIRALRRSQVLIYGNIEGVYSARQLLLGNLPVALMFDYPNNTIDPSDVAKLNNSLDVFITVRAKTRQSTLSIVIKGVEKYINDVYQARHDILKLDPPVVQASIPANYMLHMEDKRLMQLPALLALHPESPTPTPIGYLSDRSSPYTLFEGGGIQNRYQTSPSSLYSFTPNELASVTIEHPADNKYLNVPNNISPRSVSNNTSGYQSFSSSTNSLDHLNMYPSLNHPPSVNSSQERIFYGSTSRCNSSGYGSSPFLNTSDSQSSNINYQMKRNFDHSPIFDFNLKKLDGLKAMKTSPMGEPRTPTSAWTGLGLSRTSPMVPQDGISSAFMSDWEDTTSASPYRMGKTIGILDSTPVQRRAQIGHHRDLHSLLTSLGLEHYINTFVSNDIDLEIFSTLTEEDLTKLGITSFGARKKLLMAITGLAVVSNTPTNHRPKFSGSAAPGAERRTSSSS
ncbi:protein bicaudal C [Phlebotomus argentipes]|uniref:protein bicaudal C n=1 Tax=Phlebotomus argentipes TaxID=94469 RepID=UPI002892C5FC|nr:protein bicaudal C [Phlebotomus argentipes]